MTAIDPITESMRTIPAGTFQYGARSLDKFANATELPRLEKRVNAFQLSAYPVTEYQYAEFRPSATVSELPAVNVSWRDAIDYCSWLSDQTGEAFRLPTEVEWEYACRAGTDSIFQLGDTLDADDACFLYNEQGNRIGPHARTTPGSYPPNPFGLYDMLGNVCEWTSSSWTESHDLPQAKETRLKAVRGGAWDYLPRLLRCSWRDGLDQDTRRDNLGFRIAKTLP